MNTTNTATYPSVKQSWGIAGIIIGLMIITSPIMVVLSAPLGKEPATLVYYMCSIGLAFLIAHRLRRDKTGQTTYPIKKVSPKVLLLAIVGLIAVQAGVASPLTDLIPHSDFMEQLIRDLYDMKGFSAALTMVVAAPIFEELLMRGIVLDGLLKRYSAVKSILLSSFLFGLIHLNPWQFIGAFLIGILMGWIYYRTRNLLIPILLHAVNNAVAFGSGFFMDVDEALQTNLEFYGGWTNMLLATGTAIVIGTICIYLLWKEFNQPQDEEPEAVVPA